MELRYLVSGIFAAFKAGLCNTDDLRWLVGGVFAAFAAGLLYVNCPIWSLFPAVVSSYILGSKLWDELRR